MRVRGSQATATSRFRLRGREIPRCSDFGNVLPTLSRVEVIGAFRCQGRLHARAAPRVADAASDRAGGAIGGLSGSDCDPRLGAAALATAVAEPRSAPPMATGSRSPSSASPHRLRLQFLAAPRRLTTHPTTLELRWTQPGKPRGDVGSPIDPEEATTSHTGSRDRSPGTCHCPTLRKRASLSTTGTLPQASRMLQPADAHRGESHGLLQAERRPASEPPLPRESELPDSAHSSAGHALAYFLFAFGMLELG